MAAGNHSHFGAGLLKTKPLSFENDNDDDDDDVVNAITTVS